MDQGHQVLRAWRMEDATWYLAQLSDPEILRFTTESADADVHQDANGKLAGTRSATDIGGQGLAGVILSFVAAPVALLVNAAAYAVSALLLTRIRPTAAPPDQTRPQEMSSARWQELGPIVTRVLRRFDVATFCGIGLVNGLMNAVFLLYVVHDLQMSGNVIAFSIGTGASAVSSAGVSPAASNTTSAAAGQSPSAPSHHRIGAAVAARATRCHRDPGHHRL